MNNLAQFVPFVNEQIAHQEKQRLKFASGKLKSAYREALHSESRDKFSALLAEILAVAETLKRAPAVEKSLFAQIALDYDEITSLPEELLEELSSSQYDKGELQVLKMMREYGGIISLDRILVNLYKQTGEITKRPALTSRLYRMVQKEVIFSVPGKKGFYSLHPLTDDELSTLFGGAQVSSQTSDATSDES